MQPRRQLPATHIADAVQSGPRESVWTIDCSMLCQTVLPAFL